MKKCPRTLCAVRLLERNKARNIRTHIDCNSSVPSFRPEKAVHTTHQDVIIQRNFLDGLAQPCLLQQKDMDVGISQASLELGLPSK